MVVDLAALCPKVSMRHEKAEWFEIRATRAAEKMKKSDPRL
jgi:hypothetical protein